MERRLAAILAADMVGYSRLMAADETGTIARQKTHRSALIDPKIAQYGGRIVKTTGDGMLVAFPSVVDSVQCAVEIQRGMLEREVKVPDANRIQYRVGINLGDIVTDNDDILGDGVNIAARLEGLSEPGGLCISDVVYQNVIGKLNLNFDDIGEQTLKNMERKVRAWKWAYIPGGTTHESRQAPDSLPLPDKPSIAVLPFTNMSGDPEQEYFSDGITEDIVTELSRFRSLFVIARNSSFQYKGQYPNVQDVGRELGVEYVVEGSVRKAGNQMRITAQLVEAATGNHLWAERWDREPKDIFTIQDDLVRMIISTVGGRIDAVGKARVARMGDAHLGAYDLCLRAAAAEDGNTKKDYQQARQYLERAIKLDPGLASAHHHLSLVNFMEWMAHWVDDRDRAFTDAMNAAQTAVALDDTDGRVQGQLGMLHLFRREFDEAGQCFRQALRLNPNDFQIIGLHGFYLTAIGDHDHAIEQFDRAMRLNPIEPSWIKWIRGIAYFTGEKFEDAINDLRSIEKPMNEVRGWLAASYALVGRIDEARAMIAEFLRIAEQEMAVFPGRELEAWQPYWHGAIEYKNEADFDRLYEGLRTAGLE